jgi:hypothetical protein
MAFFYHFIVFIARIFHSSSCFSILNVVFLPPFILLSLSPRNWEVRGSWALGPPAVPFAHHYHVLQIQTAKTQELNMLREQTSELASELQHRQAEYEELMGQKDDLNSQLQVKVFLTCGVVY